MRVLFVCGTFVFFKQKTAYEMRISDWSSDVCSSDLHGMTFGIVGHGVHAVVHGRDGVLELGVRLHHMVAFHEGFHRDLPVSWKHGAEIGRASCRERVCQYV